MQGGHTTQKPGILALSSASHSLTCLGLGDKPWSSLLSLSSPGVQKPEGWEKPVTVTAVGDDCASVGVCGRREEVRPCSALCEQPLMASLTLLFFPPLSFWFEQPVLQLFPVTFLFKKNVFLVFYHLKFFIISFRYTVHRLDIYIVYEMGPWLSSIWLYT